MSDKGTFPRQDTLGFCLLELAAICGEFPTSLLPRIPGSSSYKEVVITSLKKEGLLRTAETYAAMLDAGAAVFRDEKPPVFLPEAVPLPVLKSPAFYGSREIKEMGIDMVKIRSSRMIGVLLTPSGIFLTYNSGPYTAKWDYRAEQRAQVLLKMVLFHQRMAFQYARTETAGLLFGDTLEPFYQIMSESDSHTRCFFLLDGNYEHFYYLTNDHYGDTLLKLLCSPEKITELDRMLMQGLSP